MSAAIKLAQWVEQKPMIVIRFDDVFSESLHNSRQGFEHLTIVKPHSVLKDFKVPTLCLMEIREQGATRCYLATAARKAAVSTFDSRLTIKKLRSLTSRSLLNLGGKLIDARMKSLFVERMPADGHFAKLSPKLSSHLIKALSADSENQAALETALGELPKLRQAPNVNWAQEDAIQTAMDVFGMRGNPIATEIAIKRGTSSGLGLVGAHIYEDNVVHADASRLQGFDAIAPDVTGRAVFQKGDERLVIYTANKLPLEEMLGVDLIYINETRGSVVMVQYKMLEEDKKGNGDWLYRPDPQLRKEISRMKIPANQVAVSDYRLSRDPFFFKFVKRKVVDDSHQSFLISLAHLNHVLAAPGSKGPRGGVRMSYDALAGTYLREADMTSLIRSGYVGTHGAETDALGIMIDAVARGNKAVVLAWQKKTRENQPCE